MRSGARGALPTLVLIHGAWHGPWCWEHVLPLLDRAGVDHAEVDLPLTGFADDVAAARSVFDAIPGRKIAVGHSYGGHVLAGAATDRDDIDQLTYVCAFMLRHGDRVQDELAHLPLTPLFEALTRTDDGRSAIVPDKATQAFYNACPPDRAEAAIARLRPMDPASTSRAAPGEPWRSIPSLYIICEQDQAISPGAQRLMAERATGTVTLDTDHSPFLSATDALAEILIGITKASRGS